MGETFNEGSWVNIKAQVVRDESTSSQAVVRLYSDTEEYLAYVKYKYLESIEVPDFVPSCGSMFHADADAGIFFSCEHKSGHKGDHSRGGIEWDSSSSAGHLDS